MGYYSDYDGEFTPKTELTDEQHNRIVDWFVKRFGDYEVTDECADCRIRSPKVDGRTEWYTGDIFFNPDDGTIKPVAFNMKGYDFNQHTYEAMEYLKSIGVFYEGEVERTGEERGDYECIRIEADNAVMSYAGHIDWSSPERVTETEAAKKARLKARFEAMIK